MDIISKSKRARSETRQVPVVVTGKVGVRLPAFLSPQILILFGTIVGLGLCFPFIPTVQNIDLPKAGDVSEETVIAPFTFDIRRPAEEVERERSRAMDRVLLVADYDTAVAGHVRDELLALKTSVVELGSKRTPDTLRVRIHQKLSQNLSENSIQNMVRRPQLIEEAMRMAEGLLDQGILSTLLVASNADYNDLKSQYNTAFEDHLIYGKEFFTLRKRMNETALPTLEIPVKEIALEKATGELKGLYRFDDESLSTLYELLDVYLTPNVNLNLAEMERRKQEASGQVLEISGKVIKETEIVRKHQEVTPDIVRKLESLRSALDSMGKVEEKRKIDAGNVGRFALVLIVLLFFALYLKRFHPLFVRTTNHLAAFSIILVMQVLLIRLMLMLLPKLFEGVGDLPLVVPEYLIPTSMGSMLVAILFGLDLSLVFSLFVSVFFGIVMGFDHFLFLLSFLGGLVACFSAHSVRYRWHFLKAIPSIAMIYVVVISLRHLIGYSFSIKALFENFGLVLINVVSANFLSMMITPIFESLFDIATDMALVELSDMNHPILKRLSIEAAGTYNHSVLVGNLAESAAQRIGANSLLARIASYYHDIGKIEKADYFAENNYAGERNRHTKLTPSMSALIISSHVKEGVELAKRYRLPKIIQDAITQHHGTGKVSFFYEKALELDPHKQVQEKDFRYPGPTPQSRENAIIMLADSVEAASRSLSTSSPKLLRELVKKIIHDKFQASQLDQCNLTLRDLDEIVEGFMPVLQGIFHTRIEYPSK